MEKNNSWENKNNAESGLCVDGLSGETAFRMDVENAGIWGRAKLGSSCATTQSSNTSQNVTADSIWSCTEKSGTQDLNWNASHQNGTLEDWTNSLPVGNISGWSGKKETSGWGLPGASPTPNAGTEGWGSSSAGTQPTWNQVPEERAMSLSSGWTEQSDDKVDAAASSTGWKSQDDRKEKVGQIKNESKSNAWPQLRSKQGAELTWSAAAGGEKKPCMLSVTGLSGKGQGQESNWEDAPQLPSTSPGCGLGGQFMGGRVDQQPVGAGQLTSSSSTSSLPAPSTWAQAAGRGLNISNSNKPVLSTFSGTATSPGASGSGSCLSRDDVIAQLVNSKDGWGKTPVRQDTSWDLDERSSNKVCSNSAGSGGGVAAATVANATPADSSSSSSQTTNYLSNTGTAIWESSKEVVASAISSRLPPIGTKDRAPGTDASQQPPLATALSNSWPPQPNETLAAPVGMISQNPTLLLNCDKSASIGGGGAWNLPDAKSGSRSASIVTDPSWNAMSKDVWESRGTHSWNDSLQPNLESNDLPILCRDSLSSDSWPREKMEQKRWGGEIDNHDHDQSHLTRQDSSSVFDSSISSQDQAQSWRAPGNSASPRVSQAAASSSQMQAQAKMADVKGDSIWSQPPTALIGKAAEWGEHGDTGLSLWNPTTSISKSSTGWGDGPWPTISKAPSTPSGLAEVSDERKMTGFDQSNKVVSQQTKTSLLQQLVDLGFCKEDVQAALLSNNLKCEQSTTGDEVKLLITDHLSNNNDHRPADLDTSIDLQKLRLWRGQIDPIPSIPIPDGTNYGGLNQASVESQVHSHGNQLRAFPSLQAPSNIGNINHNANQNLQHQQQIVSGLKAVGPASHMPNRQQQQMLHQLKMAVQSGLMSPQPQPQPPPPGPMPSPAILLSLRQLLQLQNILDCLLLQRQVLMQQNRNLSAVQPSQVEQLMLNIHSVQQQIAQQKWKIAQLQKQQQQQQLAPSVVMQQQQFDQHKDFLKDFATLQMKGDDGLNLWRMPPPSTPLPPMGEGMGSLPPPPPASHDFMPPGGSKSAQLSHSGMQQQLTSYLSDGNWPNISSMPIWPSGSSGAADVISSGIDLNCLSAIEGHNNKTLAELHASSNSGSADALDIEEFIPGKLWQGSVTKSSDGDPYMTPASMPFSACNASSAGDPYVLNALSGKSKPSSGSETMTPSVPSPWPGMAGPGNGLGGTREGLWSSGGQASVGANNPSESWNVSGMSKNARPPPGLQQSFNRSVSWTPRSVSHVGESWPAAGGISNSIVLKNFPNQIDGSVAKAVCQQYGSLQYFHYNPANRQLIVSYKSKEDAIQAQRALHSCVLANTTLTAEFVSDLDVTRVAEQNQPGGGSVNANWPQQRVSLPPRKMEALSWNGANSSVWESFGNIWGPASGSTDQGLTVPGDLLGGQ